MGNYVVLARFNADAEKRMLDVRKQLTTNGFEVPEWPPHITLAAYEHIQEEAVCAWTSLFSSRHKKQKIALSAMSVLPPGGEYTQTAVLCLEPAHSKAFVDFYYAFHQNLEEYCTGIGQYNSITHGNPIIHSTIATVKVHQLQKAQEIIFTQQVFGMAEIIALEVYTYPMRLIERFELK